MKDSDIGLLPLRAQHKEQTVNCRQCGNPMGGILDSYLRDCCGPCGGYQNTYWTDQMKREAQEKRAWRRQRGIP